MNPDQLYRRGVQRGFVLQLGSDGRVRVTRLGVPIPPDQFLEVLRPFRVQPRAQVIDFRSKQARP